MYKTIRMLPAALLLLLLGTACTNDPADNPADTGLPLVLENVYIGAQTKAEPYEPGFADGSMLEATIALDGVTTGGTYVYQDGQWTSDATAYWQNTTEAHNVTLRTPEPKDDMPAAFTQDNWHEYDLLEYSQTTTATTTFNLTHTRAQFCIALVKGDGLTDDELAAAKVTANNIGMLHTNGAHYALFDTGSQIASVEIDINGSKYPYTPQNGITLEKGKCTILTLTLNKVGVGGFQVSSGRDWQDVTATSTKDDTWTIRHSDGGNLNLSDIGNNVKLLITGTLTSKDIEAINKAKKQITDLYVTATAENDKVWEALKMNSATNLQSVYLTQATSIGQQAFNYCYALKTVSLPQVTRLENYAFSVCELLTSISLPKATIIGEQAFNNCALTSISLPKATTIGKQAFNNCSALTSISLPKATTIGEQAFNSCSELTSISLPKATTIGELPFIHCSELTSISLPKDANVHFIDNSQLTTLFISTPDATEDDAVTLANKIPTLTTVFYDYKDTADDDYLDPNNYDQVWIK